ncbi:MAG: 6-carboxytetrahydropterin synthase [Chitinivibrionia bacterium]|nr:6-carboxytetrahydropterin synthase [Chitinivibrionia bacterium]
MTVQAQYRSSNILSRTVVLSGKYTITVETSFSASHILPDCPPCDRLHGHTWKVKASWSYTRLDDKGMGDNFANLKALLNAEIRSRFDHTHLNEAAPFDALRPTAENLVREFFLILKKGSAAVSSGKLERVEVWEGPESFVSYEE